MSRPELQIVPSGDFRPSHPAIYLDHHATTPIDPRVARVVMDIMQTNFGNANSTEHAIGEAAANVVEQSRRSVAELVGAESEHVHFTSGSSEAIHLAISHAIGNRRRAPLRVAISRVEHRAVVDTTLQAQRLGLAEIAWIEVDGAARIVLESLERALRDGAKLVCVMAANNEVGTIYPIHTIARTAREAGAAMLVDATQAAGRMSLSCLDSEIDYLVLSGHKLHGPKGIGALVSPIYDAADTYGLAAYHSPTPNVPGIAGLGEACRLMALEGTVEGRRLATLRDRLQAKLLQRFPDIVINGDVDDRLPNNLNFSAPGAPNDVVIGRLRDLVALSTGSACNSGAQSPSHVLKAMGLPDELLDSCLRIGLGRQTTSADVDQAAEAIMTAIEEVRELLSGGGNG